jgi:hypothetical protein
MKTKQLLFTIILLASYNTATMSQNLDALPAAKRDSFLIALAKEFVLRIGPDYYREYKQPVITKEKTPQKGEGNPEGINAGRDYYVVTFLYDKSEEKLGYDFSAQVHIWADTGYPNHVRFGNGMGIVMIRENADWRNSNMTPIRYHESIQPEYDTRSIEIPESVIGEEAREEYFQRALKELPPSEPKNKDELLRKGWKRGSDGEWIRPDTPPAKALKVIERAKEELRRAEENK